MKILVNETHCLYCHIIDTSYASVWFLDIDLLWSLDCFVTHKLTQQYRAIFNQIINWTVFAPVEKQKENKTHFPSTEQ